MLCFVLHGGGMTVYIEYVIIDNFVIDYLLLKASLKIAGVPAKKSRLFICALFGAAVALFYPLLENYRVLTVAVKLLCGVTLTLACAKYRSPREYAITSAVFAGTTFLTGGAITGVYEIFGIPYSSETSVALIILPAYVLIKAVTGTVSFIYRRKDLRGFLYEIKLVNGNAEITATGFLDTGNGVYDGDSPVIFCGKKLAEKLVFTGGGKPAGIKRIVVATVNGAENKICFKLDRIEIYNGGLPNIYNNVTVCVADKGLGAGYDVILHPALMAANAA